MHHLFLYASAWLQRPGRVALLACACAGFMPDRAHAAGLHIAPLQVNLTTAQRTARLELFNDSPAEVVVDAQMLAWSQAGEDGQTALTPTEELVAVPPVVRIPAGKHQVIRVGIVQPALAGPVERSYRLSLTQLPPGSQESTSLQFQLQFLIPIFIAPTAPQHAEMSLQLHDESGEWVLSASNTGNVHTKITGIKLKDADAQTLMSESKLSYVLPGATVKLRLPPKSPALAVRSAEALVMYGDRQRAEPWPVPLQ